MKSYYAKTHHHKTLSDAFILPVRKTLIRAIFCHSQSNTSFLTASILFIISLPPPSSFHNFDSSYRVSSQSVMYISKPSQMVKRHSLTFFMIRCLKFRLMCSFLGCVWKHEKIKETCIK